MATRAKAMVGRDVHPHSGPWTTAETKEPMPTIIKRKPAQSTRCLVSLLTTSLTLIEQSTNAIATIGMLTKNIHLQDRALVRRPPATGPLANPTPVTLAQMPIACPCSLGETL